MVGEWKSATWGDLATLEYGKSLRSYSHVKNFAKVFGTNGPIGWHSEALWSGPGVVVGRKGAYRGVHYTEEPYWVIDTAYSLQPKVPINLRWAYYQLQTIDLDSIDDGSPIPSTTRPAFYALPVLKPPRAEQDKIAGILGSLDDKIELNRRMAETLEAMARTLFKSWFIDFDPVRAKADGRPTGLPDDLAALFPDSLGVDGLPVGWRVASLHNLATLNPESWSRATMPESIEYVDLANTKWGRIEAIQKFSSSDAPSRAQRVLRTGDTVVGLVRPGNGSFAHIRTEGLTGSTGFAVLRPTSPSRSSVVYLASTARDNIETLAFIADGAAYPAVSPADVMDTPIVLPEAGVLDSFDSIASVLLLAVQDRVEQSRTLVGLRDTLLPKLISGELRIAGAEDRFSAA